MNIVEEAKKVFATEIEALELTKNSLNEKFVEILNLIVNCHGKVIVTGIGKPGHIAKKIAATMSSLGTPAVYLHPSEALHGDLGMVTDNDIIIVMSYSGESDEVTRLIPNIKMIGAKLIVITGNKNSILAKAGDVVQYLPEFKEACKLQLAPTSSTAVYLAYGDALGVVASAVRGFTKEDFGANHPAGALGKRIVIKVDDIMAKAHDIPKVIVGSTMTDAIIEMSRKHLGVLAVVDKENKLIGIITDGDLRRSIENKIDMYNSKIEKVMTCNPQYIYSNTFAIDALKQLKEKNINNFPVIDETFHLIGMLTWQMIVKAGIML